MLTIPQVVRAAAEFGDREALVHDGRRWSYTAFVTEIERCARAFVASGLNPGDRVAIWAPNSAEWMFAALGAQMVGGVLVPINTRFKGSEAAYVIERSGASFLFVSNGFLGIDYSASLPELPTIRRAIDFARSSWSDFVALGASVDSTEVSRRADAVRPDDLSDIIFTSGTTGRPKGVMSRHDQTIRVFLEWSGVIGLNESDRYLIVNPFFHTFGYKAGFLACLLRGATMLPVATFDVSSVLRTIDAERITALPGPPTLYLSILDHPDRTKHDLGSLRLAVTGAAAVPVEMIRRMREELSFQVVLTAYGLTESTGTGTMCRVDDDPETISSTSGRAIDGVEVRVVDENNVEVPRGSAGEIVCRGYNVMPGYFDDPDATARAIDEEGWLHTGDIGVMDARGYLAITDRLKDMFIVGGFNAYPAEIENVLHGHPDVANVAVVGRPDERMGEVGHAFIVPRSGSQPDATTIIEWCRERMANYKVPRSVSFVASLPTNASGKVLKHELRSSLLDQS